MQKGEAPVGRPWPRWRGCDDRVRMRPPRPVAPPCHDRGASTHCWRKPPAALDRAVIEEQRAEDHLARAAGGLWPTSRRSSTGSRTRLFELRAAALQALCADNYPDGAVGEPLPRSPGEAGLGRSPARRTNEDGFPRPGRSSALRVRRAAQLDAAVAAGTGARRKRCARFRTRIRRLSEKIAGGRAGSMRSVPDRHPTRGRTLHPWARLPAAANCRASSWR